MKIVICNTLYPPDGIGGPERSVKITAEALVALGHDVTVLGQGFHTGDRTFHIGGVKRVSVGCPPGYQPVIADQRGWLRDVQRRIFGSLAFDLAEKYCKIILSEQPDVVHTNVLHSVDKLWSMLGEYHIPIVHTLRIYNLMCDQRMYYQGAECRFQCEPCRQKFDYRKSNAQHVTAVVGISRYVLQRHLDEGFFGAAKIKKVIGNPYDYALANPAGPKPSREPRILFMGRIHPSKGIRIFAEAARQLAGRELKFRVCGKGHRDYEDEIRRVLGTENVEWMGFVDHESAFADVDWLVVPSLWGEPFGRVVVEAFAHGIPVIASMRGAFPELVEDGKNGFLFDPAKPRALVRVMERVLLNPELHPPMRAAALISAQAFESRRVASAYELTYQEAIRLKNAVAT